MKIKLIVLACLLLVLNAIVVMPQVGRKPGLPTPTGPVGSKDAPNKLPPSLSSYKITVRFIPVGSTNGAIAASIDKAWCETRLAEINAIFKPAGLQFVLGTLDTLQKDDKLNLDVPPGSDKEGVETARQQFAAKFPKELVVFVRKYLAKERGMKGFYKAFHYSSVLSDFVVAEPGSPAWMLGHEFGHFFGLDHTFNGTLLDGIVAKRPADRVAYVAGVLASAIKQNHVTPENALDFLDGDRGAVTDTPADVGPPIFQPHDQAGEESGPGSPASISIPVIIAQSTTSGVNTKRFTYVLKPDKLNVMSYFKFLERPHLSAQQALKVFNIVKSGKRHRLVQ